MAGWRSGAAQSFPHALQLWVSEARSVHPPPQQVLVEPVQAVPASAQMQLPLTQVSPPWSEHDSH
jgi:hypothetical protein